MGGRRAPGQQDGLHWPQPARRRAQVAVQGAGAAALKVMRNGRVMRGLCWQWGRPKNKTKQIKQKPVLLVAPPFTVGALFSGEREFGPRWAGGDSSRRIRSGNVSFIR